MTKDRRQNLISKTEWKALLSIYWNMVHYMQMKKYLPYQLQTIWILTAFHLQWRLDMDPFDCIIHEAEDQRNQQFPWRAPLVQGLDFVLFTFWVTVVLIWKPTTRRTNRSILEMWCFLIQELLTLDLREGVNKMHISGKQAFTLSYKEAKFKWKSGSEFLFIKISIIV